MRDVDPPTNIGLAADSGLALLAAPASWRGRSPRVHDAYRAPNDSIPCGLQSGAAAAFGCHDRGPAGCEYRIGRQGLSAGSWSGTRGITARRCRPRFPRTGAPLRLPRPRGARHRLHRCALPARPQQLVQVHDLLRVTASTAVRTALALSCSAKTPATIPHTACTRGLEGASALLSSFWLIGQASTRVEGVVSMLPQHLRRLASTRDDRGS